MPLSRQDTVDETALLSLAGPDRTAYPLPGATVVLGAAGTVILAEAGDDPEAACVWNHHEFRLLGPAPDPVGARFGIGCGCRPLDGYDLPVHLAVRLGPGRLLYVGVLRKATAHGSNRTMLSCTLRFDPPLSDEILALVRPPSTGSVPPLPGMDWLDHVDTDPCRALELFVTDWYPTGPVTEPPPEPPRSVPPVLRVFHRLAARHPGLLGRQNYLRRPEDYRVVESGDRLVIGDENQGCWHWSIPWEPDATGTDPTVWHTREVDAPTAEPEPLSRFLLHFALYEAPVGPYVAWGSGPTAEVLPRLKGLLRRVPLRSFHSPSMPSELHVAPGVVAHTPAASVPAGGFHVTARHRSLLRPFADIGLTWGRFDG
ncbi:hypothetical protein ACFRMQ_04345 [Kitasatospora sp. NPDC056783]|uniref:hypothetical protein n=1 Tax=Kitasatospora sp. NPDC056783 TaxID=3345943 RepID=UPI00367C6378